MGLTRRTTTSQEADMRRTALQTLGKMQWEQVRSFTRSGTAVTKKICCFVFSVEIGSKYLSCLLQMWIGRVTCCYELHQLSVLQLILVFWQMSVPVIHHLRPWKISREFLFAGQRAQTWTAAVIPREVADTKRGEIVQGERGCCWLTEAGIAS